VTFSPYNTARIRINVTRALASYSRITEVEAWDTGPPMGSTSLTSASNPSVYGNPLLTATVVGATPTGTVTMTDGGTPMVGCTTVSLVGTGDSVTAQCFPSQLSVGTHTLVALYSGDPNNAPSTSAPLLQVVEVIGTSYNVGLSGNGSVASASSTYSSKYPVAAINDGERAGANWGNGGGWNDSTPDSYPDWVQLNFAISRTIDRVVVYTLQDNYASPVEPTDTMTFSLYGITAFKVQGKQGGKWVTLATVTGNNLIKRPVVFAPFSTNQVRINVSGALASYSRITEVEVWGH
jgi:Bacterial Ig-like domain (group 3)